MTDRITIAYNAVNAKLIDADREAKALVSKLLSYEVDGAEQMEAFRSGHWDGRSSFFEMRQGRFPAGFVHLVSQQLTKRGYQVQVLRKPLPIPNGPDRPIFDRFGYTQSDYDYQPQTADQLVRHGRLIAQIATGGGKSRVAQICTARIMRPTLFLTTRSVLMYQMRDHYQTMLSGLAEHHPGMKSMSKHTVGVLGDSVWDPRKFINVGMVQTLIARLKEPDPFSAPAKQAEQARIRAATIKILEMFELVILEEAHEASGNSYYDILSLCKNAHYRLALTATPFMKDSGEANMRLMAVSGPIGVRVSEKQLIDGGILAKPYFKYLEVEKPPTLFRTTRWPNCYKIGITDSVSRNAAIIKEAVRAVSYGLPVMILVQRKEHGRALETALTSNGVRAAFIFGDNDQASRKKALGALAKSEIQVLIGSTILDVGVDVPAIGMVILAGAGKAEVQLRQRIGRGLRSKKSGPNVALVVDFADKGNEYLANHAAQRRAIIEQTPGFSENILPANQDFDFKALGFDQST
jgi:superfamily II DNA or RNA helicase